MFPKNVICPPFLFQKVTSHAWGPSLWGGVRAHLAVHVSFGPDDVVVVVDDHGAAEHMQVLHHVLLGVCQGRYLRVVAWRRGGAVWCGRLAALPGILLQGPHPPPLSSSL